MKAIITIFHRRLVVPCAKKALAFKEFIEASELEDISAAYKPNTFPTSSEKPRVDVETLSPDLVIERCAKPKTKNLKPQSHAKA